MSPDRLLSKFYRTFAEARATDSLAATVALHVRDRARRDRNDAASVLERHGVLVHQDDRQPVVDAARRAAGRRRNAS